MSNQSVHRPLDTLLNHAVGVGPWHEGDQQTGA